jgi:hypothetical protein
VADVLTDPFAVAAIVVAVAGLSKLRAPAVAARALRELGIPAGSGLVRVLAAAEVALAVWCLIKPGGPWAVVLACCYAAFWVISLLLARRRASCGCFGQGEVPASVAQSLISAVLAVVCLAAAVRSPHGVGWVLGRPADEAAVLVLGIAGTAYATVLAYTRLPVVWEAWSPR